MCYNPPVGVEIPDQNKLIHYFLRGAFPNERVEIYRSAAQELGISYELIPNGDERIENPLSFMQPRAGETVIWIDYGMRIGEFWQKVNELSPPPPPPKPKSVSPDLLGFESQSTGIDNPNNPNLVCVD